MKQIEELKQRARVVTEEIKRITIQSKTLGGLSIEQRDKIKILETNLHIIEWELLGEISARIAASSPENQSENQ